MAIYLCLVVVHHLKEYSFLATNAVLTLKRIIGVGLANPATSIYALNAEEPLKDVKISYVQANICFITQLSLCGIVTLEDAINVIRYTNWRVEGSLASGVIMNAVMIVSPRDKILIQVMLP